MNKVNSETAPQPGTLLRNFFGQDEADLSLSIFAIVLLVVLLGTTLQPTTWKVLCLALPTGLVGLPS